MRYKAVVSYDGTNYNGWQVQNNKPSIQEALNNALSKITNSEIKVSGSGRTDGKVHALGQVFHFDTDKRFKDFVKSVNSQLPNDIYVRSIEEVSDDFHARFNALWKHYDYKIINGEYNPLLANYSRYISLKLDLSLMEKAAKVFEGTHDFTSFNATGKDEIEDQVRTIYKIEITKNDDLITLSFYGDGFLRYMVRMLAQTIIEAGLGKISTEEIEKILEAKDKQACHFNGEPQGLYLVEVGYEQFR